MTERENVIKWLEEAETMLTNAVDRGGDMSFFEALKCLRRVTDAIVLLKEQEVTQKDGYNLQELWKRARAGETLNETEVNFLLANYIFKQQEAIDEMVKPTKCPCGKLFDAKDSSFCPRCGCAYGELSGRYTNIGR